MSEHAELQHLADILRELTEEGEQLRTMSEGLQGAGGAEGGAGALGDMLAQLGGVEGRLGRLTERLEGLSALNAILPEVADGDPKGQAEDRLQEGIRILRESIGQLSAPALPPSAASPAFGEDSGDCIMSECLYFLLLALVVFFGYKLFKSLKDKEVKREEKRKLKQLRKKK